MTQAATTTKSKKVTKKATKKVAKVAKKAHKKAHKATKKKAKKVHKATKKAHKVTKKTEKKAAKVHKKTTKKAANVHKKTTKKAAKAHKRASKKTSPTRIERLRALGVANLLTIFRIVCIPFFILFFWLEQYSLALGIFCLAGFSDLIDGTVARMRKEKSDLGAILDPIADKGLMMSTFIALAITGVVSWWFIYIIVIRDFVVVAGFLYVKIKKVPFEYKAIWSSKIATLFEIVAGTLALIYVAFPDTSISVYPLVDIVYGAVLVATVLILIATMQYLKLGMEILEGNPKHAVSHG